MPTGIYKGNKGRTAWNKGLKGICKPNSGSFKKGENTGKKNNNWKGGIAELKELIKGLDKYNDWRLSIFIRDNFTCQECGVCKKGNLETHHIRKISSILTEFLQVYNQFSFIENRETLLRLATIYEPLWNVTNGKTLCKECHEETSNYSNSKEEFSE